jgi:hypothetical protein
MPGICEYAGLVSEVSEAGMRLLAEIALDRLTGPQVLYHAWADGQISDCDLRALIPDIWLYVDWPEHVIGVGKWVQLFRAAGFLSILYGLLRPDSAMTVFRGVRLDLTGAARERSADSRETWARLRSPAVAVRGSCMTARRRAPVRRSCSRRLRPCCP